ncbi:hypothetical protein MP228_009990 [Amoeboaphelidium protococcarum]|nr:hypothetical protein MP228_009990 [Amoeboaphelidium protococcarum]
MLSSFQAPKFLQRLLGSSEDLSRNREVASSKPFQIEIDLTGEDIDAGRPSAVEILAGAQTIEFQSTQELPHSDDQLLRLFHTLSCPVCLHLLVRDVNPVLLQCGHSFCSSCVQTLPVYSSNLKSQADGEFICCPVCRVKTELRNADSLQPADSVIAQCENIRESIVICNECDEASTEFFCPQCEMYLCVSCTHRIHSGRGTSRHILQPFELDWLDGQQEKLHCRDHEQKKELVKGTTICTDCDGALCFECSISFRHKGHEIQMIDRVTSQVQQRLQSLRKSFKTEQTKIGISRSLLKKHVNLLELNHVDARRNLRLRFDNLRQLLQQTEIAMLSEIDNQVIMKKDQFEKQLKSLQLVDCDLSMQFKVAGNVAKSQNPSMMLSMGKDVIKSSQSILDEMPSLVAGVDIQTEVPLDNLKMVLQSIVHDLPQYERPFVSRTKQFKTSNQSRKSVGGKRRHEDGKQGEDEVIMLSPKRLKQSEYVQNQRRPSMADPEEWKRRVLANFIDSSYLTLKPKNWELVYAGHQNVLDQRYDRRLITVSNAMSTDTPTSDAQKNDIVWQKGQLNGLPILCDSNSHTRKFHFTKDHLVVLNSTRSVAVIIQRENPQSKFMQRLLTPSGQNNTDNNKDVSEVSCASFLMSAVNPLVVSGNPTIATGHQDGSLRFWTMQNTADKPSFVCMVSVQAHSKQVAFINGYDSCFASCTVDGDMAIWKFPTGQRDRADLKTLLQSTVSQQLDRVQVQFLEANSAGFFVGLSNGVVALVSAEGKLKHAFVEPEMSPLKARREQVDQSGSSTGHGNGDSHRGENEDLNARPFSPRSHIAVSRPVCALTKRYLFVSSYQDPYSICVYDIAAALDAGKAPYSGKSVGFLYRLAAHDIVPRNAYLKSISITMSGLKLLAYFAIDQPSSRTGNSSESTYPDLPSTSQSEFYVLWNFAADEDAALDCEYVRLQSLDNTATSCFGWYLKQVKDDTQQQQQPGEEFRVKNVLCRILK